MEKKTTLTEDLIEFQIPVPVRALHSFNGDKALYRADGREYEAARSQTRNWWYLTGKYEE